jgi:hypothetical protein
MKYSMLNKCLCKVLFFILISAVFIGSFPIVVGDPGTVVKVDPATKTVEQGVTFSIDVLVVDVVDLYTWQIKLQFDPTVLQCEGATYPSDHVFAGQPIVPVTPVIDNIGGTVLYGCTLMGGATTFTGSGKLCRIDFRGIKSGTSSLQFLGAPTADTYLLNYDMDTIPITVEDGSVTVQPTTKPPSEITIDVSPTSIFVSESITISGYITPSRPNVDVTILKDGAFLASVKTDTNSRYEYVWRTIGTADPSKNDVGEHKIKAKWDGDNEYQGATSEEKTVVVQNAGPMLYNLKYVFPTGEHNPSAPADTLYLHNFTDPTSMYSGRYPPVTGPKKILIPFHYTLYVLISNVSDLYAWELKLYVSDYKLANCSSDSIWIPQNGVFAGTANILERKVEPHGNGLNITIAVTQTSPNPSYSVSGENTTHTRIGILCAINFTSLYNNRVFTIDLFPESISLKNSAGHNIPYRIENLQIEAGIFADEIISTRKSSTLTLDANPKKVKLGENITITGKLDPDMPDFVEITIIYNGTTPLAIVETVKPFNSTYMYVWTPNASGTYKLKATWEGSLEYDPDESDEVTVTVVPKEGEAGEDYTLYIIIIVIVIVIVVGVVVYFKKFRKPKIPIQEEST